MLFTIRRRNFFRNLDSRNLLERTLKIKLASQIFRTNLIFEAFCDDEARRNSPWNFTVNLINFHFLLHFLPLPRKSFYYCFQFPPSASFSLRLTLFLASRHFRKVNFVSRLPIPSSLDREQQKIPSRKCSRRAGFLSLKSARFAVQRDNGAWKGSKI